MGTIFRMRQKAWSVYLILAIVIHWYIHCLILSIILSSKMVHNKMEMELCSSDTLPLQRRTALRCCWSRPDACEYLKQNGGNHRGKRSSAWTTRTIWTTWITWTALLKETKSVRGSWFIYIYTCYGSTMLVWHNLSVCSCIWTSTVSTSKRSRTVASLEGRIPPCNL